MIFKFSITAEERTDMIIRLFTVWFIVALTTIALSSLDEHSEALIFHGTYCFSIGTLMWLFVDFGDLIVFDNQQRKFPYTRIRYVFATAGAMAGTFIGFLIGDWYSNWGLLQHKPRYLITWLAINILITYAMICFFSMQHRQREDKKQSFESRLKLLESQLEPHMLFNTLANLRALVVSDTVRATQMLDRIVSYMRAIVHGSRKTMHTLSDEFDRLADYMDLMKLRMGERLIFSLYLSPELNNYLVPPFILQPLVENAIKHGLEPKVEGGRIFIVATIEGKMISLEVNDTGTGTKQDDLIETKGFGWSHVAERLKATYGDKATINLVAIDGYSTCAKVTLPYVETEIAFE
jgi:LytS/YehU family sensor histidine kinase